MNPEDSSRGCFPAAVHGEVLSSIEDLQQVVRDLTLDEIKDAEEKVSLMVRRLSSLQAVCENFTAIREFVIKAQAARLHASAEDSREPAKEIPQQQPAAPNPTGETDRDSMTGSKEGPPITQHHDFTLGENRLGEEKFELGFSITRDAEEKLSDLDTHHYATIVCKPDEISPATFSFHEDQGSTELAAAPKLNRETLAPGFFDRMIDNFTAFVGPMAALIVEEQVTNLGESFTAFPRSRLDELIALVGREIPDDQSKVHFQKQMAEKIRALLPSPAPLALPRNKK